MVNVLHIKYYYDCHDMLCRGVVCFVLFTSLNTSHLTATDFIGKHYVT
jgi:hypothetical protein